MALSALRNLPKEAQDARRARIGMSPAVPQDYSGRDLTGELLSAGSLALSPVPVLGDLTGLAADARMYQMRPEERTMGNFAMTLAGLLPLIPSVAATKTAVRSAEAIKEGAKRGIDLAEADKMQRALDLGYSTQDFYHATMQDLEEFKPIYNNGLTFLTPNAEFANKWLGKGALRTRVGDDSVEAMKKLDRLKLIKKYESEIGVPADSWTGDIWDDYWKKYLSEESKIQREYDNVHKTIYQLRTNVQNTFDPQQHENVVIDLLRSKGVDPQGSFQNGLSNLDAYKQGNYLLYETKPTVDFLKNKGFDSMWLRESTYSPEDIAAPYSTLAVFDPANIRSKSAEFDKGQRLSRNISAGVAGTALGLSALRNINKDSEQMP